MSGGDGGSKSDENKFVGFEAGKADDPLTSSDGGELDPEAIQSGGEWVKGMKVTARRMEDHWTLNNLTEAKHKPRRTGKQLSSPMDLLNNMIHSLG